MSQVTGEIIVLKAREYIGTPFVHAGRQKRLGVDCVGLVLCVAHELSLTSWDDRNYTKQVNPDRLVRSIELHCREVPREQMDAGDVILFAVGRRPQHVGFYSGRGTVIHTYQQGGVVCEHSLGQLRGWRIIAVYRWRGLFSRG